MTTPSVSSLKSHMLKLRAATEKWYAQILLYLVLVAAIIVIDQFALVVYRILNNLSGSTFGWFLLTGAWISGIANAVVIVIAVRVRTLFVYLLATAVLNYLLAIAYHFLTGLDVQFSSDSMGELGAAIVWSISWFWGSVIGLIIKLIDLPSVFRLPTGGGHATCFSCG